MEGTGLTCKMKNRNQLTPSKYMYLRYSVHNDFEGERVTSFPFYMVIAHAKIPFQKIVKCPVSPSGT